jgi:hypothetical protein
MLRRLETSAGESGRPAARAWVLPIAVCLVAVGGVVLSLPAGGPGAWKEQALQADREARGGEVDRAAARWKSLWAGGARAPGLAARLAWAAARGGDVVRSSAWVLRGERGEPRDAALVWTAGQVRDAGGLEGYSRARLPVRNLEWGVLALIAALMGTWTAWTAGRARLWSIAILAFAVLFAAAPTLDAARAAARRRAVVSAATSLLGEGVDLTPGQVVHVLQVRGDRARIAAGPQVAGEVPLNALILEESGR